MAFSGLTRILATCARDDRSKRRLGCHEGHSEACGCRREAGGPAATAGADFTIYDRVIDPVTAAIRDALLDAGREGAFLDKRDAAGVAEYYAEQGYAADLDARRQAQRPARSPSSTVSQRPIPMASIPTPTTRRRSISAAMERCRTRPTLAKADVMLSSAIVTYARQAYAGRLVPSAGERQFRL